MPTISLPCRFLAIVAVLLAATPSRAQSAGPDRLSVPGAGVTFDFEMDWVVGSGYFPMRVKVTAPGPVAADRLFHVRAGIAFAYSDRDALHVTQSLELPAGSATAQVTMRLPIGRRGSNRISLVVFEDGSQVTMVQQLPSSNTSMFMPPPVLFVDIDPELADFHKALMTHTWKPTGRAFQDESHRVPPIDYSGQARPLGVATASQGNTVPIGLRLAADQLPANWLDYSACAVVCLPLSTLEDLARKRPAALSALRGWVQSGGNLWVIDVQSGADRVAKVLQLPSDVAGRRAWHNATGPIVSTTLGLGWVVAFRHRDPFATDTDWPAVFDGMELKRLDWNVRHGLHLADDNPGAGGFRVPGVGTVPVNSFWLLITAFVVVIGPVNYMLLRRWKRLHYLLLTIPLGAAAVVGCLFLYALLVDGLGTRVRVRSLTVLDQRAGRAATWARLSYYAGLSPGTLRFPGDTAIYPLDEHQDQRPRREMVWDDEQRLTSGWVPARTPTQLLTISARASQRRLDVNPSTDAEGLSVCNRLGARVECLLVKTESGLYWGDKLEDGQAATLESIEPEDAGARLRRIALQNHPEGESQASISRRGFIFRRRESHTARRWIGDDLSSSRLEDGLSVLTKSLGDGGPLPTRSYIAIVERSPEVSLGTPRAKEEKSLHVILGNW